MNRNCNPLFIEDYQDLIDLYSEFQINKANKSLNVEQKTTILTKLHDYLCSELENNSPLKMYCEESSNYEELRAKVRALLTVRAPLPLPEWFNGDFDKILQNELLNRDLVDTSKLPTIADQFAITEFKDKEKCVLWRGDISLLQVDAIVNAANSAMLGCFIPFHKCIDNIIHSRSGPRLRDDCSTIIKKQDCFEEVGWAKITRAYNLPSIYVIHTYGPDLSQLGKVAKLHEKQ
ncbi:MAG: macro domain-containing protein, partial [Candidatus Heimdallarchaeota archaeon]